MMKKVLFILLVAVSITACSLDDGESYDLYFASVEEVEIPDTLVYNQDYDFQVTFEKSSDCQTFVGYDYASEEHVRFISPVVRINDNSNCASAENETQTETLSFLVKREDYYIFRFWQGYDENNEPQFLEKEVPVIFEEIE